MTEKGKCCAGCYMTPTTARSAPTVCGLRSCAMPTISCGPRTRPGCGSSSSGFWGNGRDVLRDGPVLVRLRLQHPARGALLRQPQSRHSRLRRGDVRRARVRGAKLQGFTRPATHRRRVPRAGVEYAYPITVGDHVWIGGGVQVMPGVTIGSNVDRGRQRRRRLRHSERFGRCRQSV